MSRSDNLTAIEWGYVKRHPLIGAELLKGSESVVLQVGEVIALTHHERWDGTGYPQGLKGEEIPMGGRICALADVFDALTTKRSYKPEVNVEDAIELIQDASNQLFDPQLVSIFVQNIEEIKKIRQHNL
jgi:putative two-component system response regulator